MTQNKQNNGYDIYHDLIIQAPIQDVYNAITHPAHLVNWWPLRCSGKPKEGEIYNFYFTPQYDWQGEVIQATEPLHFHIKMTKSDEDWNPTSFGFDLEQTKDGIQLHFRHTNWPSCNHHFKRSSYCWAILLQGLKNYVEKEIIVPFEERE